MSRGVVGDALRSRNDSIFVELLVDEVFGSVVFSGYKSQLRLEGTRKRRGSQQLYRGELQLHSLPHLISMKYTVCVGNRKRRGSMFRNQNSKTRLEHENHPNKQETESISILSLYSFS